MKLLMMHFSPASSLIDPTILLSTLWQEINYITVLISNKTNSEVVISM